MRCALTLCLLVLLTFLGFSVSLYGQTATPILNFEVDADQLAHVTVTSSPNVYHVLYAQNTSESTSHAVALELGQAGTAELIDHLPALPEAAYSVLTYQQSAPGDVDGDGRDDLSELRQAGNGAALNHADPILATAGDIVLAEAATFDSMALSSTGAFSYLVGSVFTKVYFTNNRSRDSMQCYFVNVGEHLRHRDFADAVGIATQPNGLELEDHMRGTLVYHPEVVAPNGVQGLYTYQFRSFDEYDFELIQRTHDLLAANMPFLRGNLAFRPLAERALDAFARDRALYEASRVQVVSEEELIGDLNYAAFNTTVGFGRLRRGGPDIDPGPFDIMVLDVLPNTLQRVGGIISSTLQTPLSHVNLRAVQDGVPNCYVKSPFDDPRITPLLDEFVRLEVREDTFLLRAASRAEVDQHFESLRPDTVRRFSADLGETSIKSLRDIGAADAIRFGAKAANLAEMHNFGFVAGTLPEGFAVPFAVYDDFMRRNGLYTAAQAMLDEPSFRESFDQQRDALKALRRQIKDGSFLPEQFDALTQLQDAFPTGSFIRCRSSTNGEDLPGFSGAGLYDSKTQRPDEGHIEKSIKQVFASVWTYRAFLERDFYRIDHFSAKMGVLVHPSYKEERVNGVAVSYDPRTGRTDRYYINAQLGENLVTNPEDDAVPEELYLLRERGSGLGWDMIRRSNLVPFGERVLDSVYLNQLRPHLRTIHDRFAEIYQAADDPTFAMEIEFKVDSSGQLAIKQARPWAGYVPPERDRPSLAVGDDEAYRLYPNPVTSVPLLIVPEGQPCQLTVDVLSTTGQQVMQLTRQLDEQAVRIRLPELLDDLAPGVYILRARRCGELVKSSVFLR